MIHIEVNFITESEYHICQKCIITDGFFNLRVNSEGLCNYCSDPTHANPNWRKVQISEGLRSKGFQDWSDTIKKMKETFGNEQYSCVLGFSGGKDSTALVDTFINEYNLKPFLVTLDTGYMTKIAKENIKQTLKKMNLEGDHMFLDSTLPIFTKLYKTLFFNHDSNDKGMAIEVCHVCTDLLHTLLVKEAMKRGLKHVIIGFSPDQIARYFYETSKEDTLKDGFPRPELLKEQLNEEELNSYLNKSTSIDALPRVLYPYHVIDYDENEIIARIEEKGLINKGKGNPVLTNCHVVKVALMYDLYRYGGITYALQYAELVRQKTNEEERKRARKELIIVLLSFARSIFRGKLNVEGFTQFFERIGTTREELLETIEQQREHDPNKDIILKNLELIKKMQLR